MITKGELSCSRKWAESTHWLPLRFRKVKDRNVISSPQLMVSLDSRFSCRSNVYKIGDKISEFCYSLFENTSSGTSNRITKSHLQRTQTANLGRYLLDDIIANIKQCCRRSTIPDFHWYDLPGSTKKE